MIDLEVQSHIAKPAGHVYDFVVTNYFQNHPRWDGRVVRSELINATVLAVGSVGV